MNPIDVIYMESDKMIEAYASASAVEKIFVEMYEEALEGVHDEAVRHALKRLERLSEIRYWKSFLNTEVVGLQHDLMLEPILERLAEEKKILDKMK